MNLRELDRKLWECRDGANTAEEQDAAWRELGAYVDVHASKVLAALTVCKRLEWAVNELMCPMCRRTQDAGHAKHCEIARALAR